MLCECNKSDCKICVEKAIEKEFLDKKQIRYIISTTAEGTSYRAIRFTQPNKKIIDDQTW